MPRYVLDFGFVAETVESDLLTAAAVKAAVESGAVKSAYWTPGMHVTVTKAAPARPAPTGPAGRVDPRAERDPVAEHILYRTVADLMP